MEDWREVHAYTVGWTLTKDYILRGESRWQSFVD